MTASGTTMRPRPQPDSLAQLGLGNVDVDVDVDVRQQIVREQQCRVVRSAQEQKADDADAGDQQLQQPPLDERGADHREQVARDEHRREVQRRAAVPQDDNRVENLELWTRPQPSGIRARDAVAWAKEILARYDGADTTTLTD